MDSDFKQRRQRIYVAMQRERPGVERRARAATSGRYRGNLAREWRLLLLRTVLLD